MLNGTFLIIIDRHEVESNHLLDVLFVIWPVELLVEIVVEFLFQRLKLGFRIIIIAFETRHALQVFQIFVAHAVIGEAALDNVLLKQGIVGIGKLKL